MNRRRYFLLIPEGTLLTVFTLLVQQIRDSILALARGHSTLVKCRSIEITPSTTATLKLVPAVFLNIPQTLFLFRYLRMSTHALQTNPGCSRVNHDKAGGGGAYRT